MCGRSQNKAAVIRRINPSENRLGIDCMKWGLVLTGLNLLHNVLKTINARDDKVIEPRGLWNSVKGQSVVSFFEWLDKGKDKIPHFVKRTDHTYVSCRTWDSVTFKGSTEELHTFTIITLPQTSIFHFFTIECRPDFLRPISQRKGNIMSFFKQQVSPSKPSSSSKSGTSSSNPKAKITGRKGVTDQILIMLSPQPQGGVCKMSPSRLPRTSVHLLPSTPLLSRQRLSM
ncbi:hypothetical protein H4Q26_008365 [Puccinia striiformis f. sp. tritici PST-130]|nr:hypothetical protein H4Q26_008365 [Puccinia striiformis f. sp. tritici PST-130]